jgi:hypothetical protein
MTVFISVGSKIFVYYYSKVGTASEFLSGAGAADPQVRLFAPKQILEKERTCWSSL